MGDSYSVGSKACRVLCWVALVGVLLLAVVWMLCALELVYCEFGPYVGRDATAGCRHGMQGVGCALHYQHTCTPQDRGGAPECLSAGLRSDVRRSRL